MVTVAAANIAWKRKKYQMGCPPSNAELKPKFPRPTKPPWEKPNIREKPTKKKPIAPADISQAFFMTMLMAFLEREKPISNKQNPACIRKTKAADIRTKSASVLSKLLSSVEA